MYAVVDLKWHQYIVQEGDTLTVDAVDMEAGSTLLIDTVLMTFDTDGSHVAIGAPYLAKAKVECEVVEHKKWDKIRVIKFKRKTRYQRTIGFRPHQSILHIKKFSVHE